MTTFAQQKASNVLTRTHMCGTLGVSDVGSPVVLSGWVQRRRDLGGVIFVDLRDRSGIVQIVFSHEFAETALAQADQLRNEFVVAVCGNVVLRDHGTVNDKIATGQIEVRVNQLEIVNKAKTPPFPIEDGLEVDESVRLRYRYLDLRRPEMRDTLLMRHKVMKRTRDFLDGNGFVEIETPMLTKSTPEGARDYLVPSRVRPGEFYALPQSPQLFKQLLMVSGFERYFQIVRCFRDEDLRADRQPEFTQIDIEMSFLPLADFQALMEQFVVSVLEEIVDVRIQLPLERLTYSEVMARFGSDKPDLRFGLELVDLSDILQEVEFKVFRAALDKGGQVKAINAKGCATYSRREIDLLGEYAARYGAKGMAWITMAEDGPKSPILKFLTVEQLKAIVEACGAETGDLLLFASDKANVVADVLGNLRLKLGRDLSLIDESAYKLLWVTEFPLVEYDDEAKRYVALHHPFTMPMWEDLDALESDPASVRAQAYDLVLNGYEIGGGSMRIFQRDVQEAMFRVLGFSDEESREKFGFLLDAFEYGTPPHGGIALGLDRWIMIMAGRNSLRDCIAFPKTASGTCLLTEAPSTVAPKQLADLHIATVTKPTSKS